MRALLFVLLACSAVALATNAVQHLKNKAMRSKALAMHESHEHLRTTGHFGYDCQKEPEVCPTNWGALKLVEGTVNECGSTKRQSPINLPRHWTTKYKDGVTLDANYKKFMLSGSKIFNNGHTVEMLFPKDRAGSLTLQVKDKKTIFKAKYNLEQFHMHTPSEHTIAGEQVPMELHLVHRRAEGQGNAVEKNSEALLVVGLFFTEGPENYLLSTFFDNIPSPPAEGKGENVETISGDVEVDLMNLLVRHTHLNHFWNYKGSLTTPPCSEIVEWFVIADPLTASKEQLKKLKSVIPDGTNARPTLKLNQDVQLLRRGYA